MRIEKSLEEISDGRLYDLNDMVKADTRGCDGCSACCYGVGETMGLNPFDLYQITTFLELPYERLLDTKIELHIEEKLTLPNLKMIGALEGCGFLDKDERCVIHDHRPSVCRMFPLGRYYDQGSFKYIYKPGDCIMPDPSKIKVKKWINIANYEENKAFILDWYKFLKALKWRVKFIHDKKELAEVNTYVINHFFNIQWDEGQDFYRELEARIITAKDKLGLL